MEPQARWWVLLVGGWLVLWTGYLGPRPSCSCTPPCGGCRRATIFLAPKLANATRLYGLLGIAATVLFWLYVLGRLTIGQPR